MGLERIDQGELPQFGTYPPEGEPMDPRDHPAHNKPTATHHFDGGQITTGAISDDWQELTEYKGRLVDPYKMSPKDLRTHQHYKDRGHN